MGKHIGNLFLVLLVLLGAGLLAYPSVSDWYNSSRQSRAILDYDQRVASLDPLVKLRALGEADAYNDALRGEGGDGSMGYLEIPSIGVKLQIFHGTEETVLSKAVGHMAGSSLPVGGAGTHAVLTGHRGLPSAKLFTDIGKLETGDRFQLDNITTVLPDEMNGLAIVPGEDLVTLVTCTPYGINSHRMLIRGHRIQPEKEPPKLVSEASRINPATVAACLSAPALALAVIFLIL